MLTASRTTGFFRGKLSGDPSFNIFLSFSAPMRWNDQHDTILCREILMIRPYQFKSCSKESGNESMDLNAVQEVKVTTTQKSVRDRFKLLLDKHNKKMRTQIGASGSVATSTELDILLSEIKEVCEKAQEEFDKELHATKITENKIAE